MERTKVKTMEKVGLEMMRESYATIEDYKQLGYDTIPEEELIKELRLASRKIDSLTYNRIIGKGFTNLSEFQQGILKEVCCEVANFYFEYKDMIESPFTGYGINGVSMQFGTGQNVKVQNGVFLPSSTYLLLCQTGFCCRLGVMM